MPVAVGCLCAPAPVFGEDWLGEFVAFDSSALEVAPEGGFTLVEDWWVCRLEESGCI